MDNAPNKLTPVERLMLHNQYLILAKLDPKNEEEHLGSAQTVVDGVEVNYPDLFLVLDTEISQEESRYAAAVLDMFGDLKRSYDALTDKGGIDEYSVTFPGFDGNDEGAYYAYAAVLKRKGRYGWIKNLDKNSHGMGAGHSQAMVERFQAIRRQKMSGGPIHWVLSADEIHHIIGR